MSQRCEIPYFCHASMIMNAGQVDVYILNIPGDQYSFQVSTVTVSWWQCNAMVTVPTAIVNVTFRLLQDSMSLFTTNHHIAHSNYSLGVWLIGRSRSFQPAVTNRFYKQWKAINQLPNRSLSLFAAATLPALILNIYAWSAETKNTYDVSTSQREAMILTMFP